MRRARRFPLRLVRWTSLCVCFALVLTSFVLFPSQVSIGKTGRYGTARGSDRVTPTQGQGNGQERRVTPRAPQPGPPPGNVPNLDDMKRMMNEWRANGGHNVHAPDPVPSTQRRVKHGQQQRAEIRTKENGNRSQKANHARGSSPTVRKGSLAVATTAYPEPQGTDDMAMARIDPHNRTGTGGVDPLSNNFNWSLGLLGLKGRGLDLGLSLSYNSLATWTLSGNTFAYDVDQTSPAFGFRLGFPVVQGPYYSTAASTYFYILITPSGAHQELRQISTYVFQAVDASYAQLTVSGSGSSTSLVYMAQGSQLTFSYNPGFTEFHCTEVKDRNGNYLTIAYNSAGELSTVTDTLGRVVTFNYDGNNCIQSITQPWGSTTHTWASFGWTTTSIGSNIFSGKTYSGPSGVIGNSSFSVLSWVGLPDGSKYYFDYDGSYGVVYKIRYYANTANTPNERRQTTYAITFSNSDVPRVTQERNWAASWNGDTDETPASGEEAVSSFDHDTDGGCRVTSPDGAVDKEYYGSTWQSGLTTETRSYANATDANNNSWKKKTTTAWIQEDTGVSYLTNPRVTETNIYDSEGNRRRTTIDYGSTSLGYVQYSLPYLVQEYAADGSTVLRNTYTDYNLDSSYLNKRIIGLVSAVHVSDSAWQSKTTYDYDTTTIDSQAASTTHHDGTNYSASFTARGNVTKVWSWDVTDITNSSKALRRAQIVYDTAGSVMSNTDALDHPNSITYSSSFDYAYPTSMTDAASNSSTVSYDFYTGAVTQTQGAALSSSQSAMAQSFAYDSVGRIQWITRSDGFWKYIAYADRGDAVMSQTSLTVASESAWSIMVVDGADRTRLVGHDLPNSTGGYAGAFTLYDNMGRVSQQSNVEETNAYWSPAQAMTRRVGCFRMQPSMTGRAERRAATIRMEPTEMQAMAAAAVRVAKS